MKLLGLFALVGLAGAFLGLRFGADAVEGVFPEGGTHGAWFASRAAGIAAYLCLWLGLVGGLLMSSAWFDGLIGRARLLAFHQAATITGVVMGLGHALVLMQDGWTHFGLVDVLVPFASYYKSSLTTLGTVAFYLSLVISGTFWLRPWIGPRMWKLIHYTSFACYLAALWHGIKIGTDTQETWAIGLYFATSMTVITGLVVRMTYARPSRRRQPAPAAPPPAAHPAHPQHPAASSTGALATGKAGP